MATAENDTERLWRLATQDPLIAAVLNLWKRGHYPSFEAALLGLVLTLHEQNSNMTKTLTRLFSEQKAVIVPGQQQKPTIEELDAILNSPDDRPVWYLDCFCYGAACGRDFPVNSYYSESLEVVIEHANRILANPRAGIDEARISKETKGQNPMYLTLTAPSGAQKPTIEELDAILNSPDDRPVRINPDGSVTEL